MAERWRTGRKVGRTIYRQLGPEPSDHDELIGVMDHPSYATLAVGCVNMTYAQVTVGWAEKPVMKLENTALVCPMLGNGGECDKPFSGERALITHWLDAHHHPATEGRSTDEL